MKRKVVSLVFVFFVIVGILIGCNVLATSNSGDPAKQGQLAISDGGTSVAVTLQSMGTEIAATATGETVRVTREAMQATKSYEELQATVESASSTEFNYEFATKQQDFFLRILDRTLDSVETVVLSGDESQTEMARQQARTHRTSNLITVLLTLGAGAVGLIGMFAFFYAVATLGAKDDEYEV